MSCVFRWKSLKYLLNEMTFWSIQPCSLYCVFLLIVILRLTMPTAALIRHYYVAAVEVDWNFAETGQNLVDDRKR